MRITPHQEQQGFVTIAQNTAEVNYLDLAYVQAMSIKTTMPGAKYAVIVDEYTASCVATVHRKVFDYIITLPDDSALDDEWKLANEWKIFYLTPFKETIKLEADIVFPRSIKHWWNTFRLKNIVLSTDCKDFMGNNVINTSYRKVFVDNDLPNVYSGLMYFRYSQEAAEFFKYAEDIFKNWTGIMQRALHNCADEKPTTDVVYAIAAKILGIEKCTLPLDFINFVHMKPDVNNWPNADWPQIAPCELDLPMIRINNVNQYHPVHYHVKSWVTPEIIAEYEACLLR